MPGARLRVDICLAFFELIPSSELLRVAGGKWLVALCSEPIVSCRAGSAWTLEFWGQPPVDAASSHAEDRRSSNRGRFLFCLEWGDILRFFPSSGMI